MACKQAAVRARWGCDQDVENPVYAVDCWICSGIGYECDRCNGTGKIPMPRCPGRCNTTDVRRVVAAYNWMKKGFLPVEGGYLDQAQTFLNACDFIGAMVAHHEEKARQKAKDTE